jgi:transcriptional regulator with XRE-family HTH domain
MAQNESGGAEDPSGDGSAEASTPVDGTLSALADVIRVAQRHARLSQSEIGRRIGVDQTVVSTWVRGVTTPSVERILALDRVFGLRPGTLLERAGLIEPRTTEEAIAAEPTIQEREKNVLQGIVAARRCTADSPAASLDDLFVFNRARLQQAVDEAVARAFAVRRPTVATNIPGVEGGWTRPERGPLRSAFDRRRHRQLTTGR